MGMGAWDSQLRGHRGGIRPKARLKEVRKARARRVELEGLENRTLLATIPAAAATAAPQNLSQLMGNIGGPNGASAASESSPVVAVNPLDPTKLVSVWIDNDPTEYALTDDTTFESVLEAAYSIDGGQVWLPLMAEPTSGLPSEPEVLDPATSGPTIPYKYVTGPSVGFDDSGNVYILSEYSNDSTPATSSSGAVVLQKYSFTGSAPVGQAFTGNEQTPNPYGFGGFGGSADAKIIYQWMASGTEDQAINATMTVDDNLATIPSSVNSQADPYSGNIYVAWTSIDVNTAIPITPFNPNRTKLEVSSDGGNNFSPLTVTNLNSAVFTDDGNFTTEKDTSPAITVAQGQLASESGQGGAAGIPGGQVTVGWDDFGDSPAQLMANSVMPAATTRSASNPTSRMASSPKGAWIRRVSRSRSRSLTPPVWTPSKSR